MNEDYYMRCLKRAIEQRAKQPANTASKLASIEPVVTKPVLTALQSVKQQVTKTVADKPEFNLGMV